MGAERFPRHIFLHYLDHEVIELYGLQERYVPQQLDQIFRRITRHAYLRSVHRLLLPCSSYFESLEAQRLFQSIRPLIDGQDVALIMSQSDVAEFAESKQSSQYSEDPSRYPSYADPAVLRSLKQLSLPIMDRTGSSGLYIRKGWIESVERSDGLWQQWMGRRKLTWTTMSKMEQHLQDLPSRLGESAFIWPFVSRRLEVGGLDALDEKRFQQDISRSYIKSYLIEYEAAILRELPIGTLECGLPAADSVSFADNVVALDGLGLTALIDRLSWSSLVVFKHSPEYVTFKTVLSAALDNPGLISAGYLRDNGMGVRDEARTQRNVWDRLRIRLERLSSCLQCSMPEGNSGEPRVTAVVRDIIVTERGDIIMGDKYSGAQVGAMGPNAHAHDITFQQVWNQIQGEVNLPVLTIQLERLRQAMRQQGATPEHDVAIGAIAAAQSAAAQGDGPTALARLKDAGVWAFDVASKIGVNLATAALKSALGLP
jgi:hypothetical protein